MSLCQTHLVAQNEMALTNQQDAIFSDLQPCETGSKSNEILSFFGNRLKQQHDLMFSVTYLKRKTSVYVYSKSSQEKRHHHAAT